MKRVVVRDLKLDIATNIVTRDINRLNYGVSVWDLGSIGIKIPKNCKRYRVKYKLDKDGKYLCTSWKYQDREISAVVRFKDKDNENGAILPNCLLPREWEGRRISRSHEVLERWKRAYGGGYE